MKQEIINCFTWYTNRVAETVQYTSWSDEYCRTVSKSKIKESREISIPCRWINY